MAGRDGTSAKDKDYKMVPAKDGKGNTVKDGKGNPVMTKKYLTKADKAEPTKSTKDTKATKSSAKASKPTRGTSPAKKDLVSMIETAIDRTDPKRPKARPGTTRPKARSGPGPAGKTASSVSTPEVETKKLPKRGSTSSSSRTSSSEDKPDRFQQSPGERVRGFGNWLGRLRSGGGLSQRGMAKGGMVKANCGASMKPTQKSTRKK